ncbi:uncharacterized protein EI90DRAFT_3034481 [Cantharellus anzutake]|uniref:uncharacterized protein n=1 Tax=Cantharellus anzutake TaxID=1750568 RepID=UPI0019044432|nr:uncharacterized protein EI90DRAFT_3034481 [Cantharellus anzutake]KAF8341570.1 hypothetical protein EI90DRAFT_3034481 [Cantharellus anzutake]
MRYPRLFPHPPPTLNIPHTTSHSYRSHRLKAALEVKSPAESKHQLTPDPALDDLHQWSEDNWGQDACLEWHGNDPFTPLLDDDAASTSSASSTNTLQVNSAKVTARRSAKPSRAKSNKYRAKTVVTSSSVPLHDDAAVDNLLERMILDDKKLHLRVLRYEPINFEVFYNLALAQNLNPKGLRRRLLSFLDSQCIQFQQSGPPNTAGRRRKHH